MTCLAVDEALDRLAAESTPQAAELVKLRFFAGLSVERGGRRARHLARNAYRHWTLRPGLAPRALTDGELKPRR